MCLNQWIGIVVGGFYTRDNSNDDVLVTVTRPLDNMVTGGGYLINQDSAGLYAGDDGLRTNFGFNVKFNRQLTALQGHVTIIIRQNGFVYQVKTNAMQSLAVDPVAHKGDEPVLVGDAMPGCGGQDLDAAVVTPPASSLCKWRCCRLPDLAQGPASAASNRY